VPGTVNIVTTFNFINQKDMKTAIVTGASGNLGGAVIKKFLKEGYTVVGTVIHDTSAALNISDAKFEAVRVDLMNEKAAGQFVKSVVEKYNTIHVAILTVGGFAMGKIVETKTSDILKQYKLNFETTYNVARPVFEQMMQQGYGRIFMTGSLAGLDMKNSKGMTAYGLSKSLVFRLAEIMNQEGNEHNIYTTVIAPSTIDTPQNRQSMPHADFSKWTKPETIADIIYESFTNKSLNEAVINV
jgi:NAD(P)-dependent dehydrogenase (short-subunit alcohol dehydrogenase family)